MSRGVAFAALVSLVVSACAQMPTHKHTMPHSVRAVAARSYSPLTSQTSGAIQVDLTTSHVLSKFEPALALGASVDAIGTTSQSTLFSSTNLTKMLSAGEGSLSYRLYTELNVEDWHWNPTGTWSDSKNSQGYFVGSSNLGGSIEASHGYFLTHRGATFDFGSNLQYSNIDDGNPTTYWKSNPYLTSTYTHVSDSLHPQWIFVVLNSPQYVNAVQIHWANPYAVSYSIQYWTGDDPVGDPGYGSWVNFPGAVVTGAKGGAATVKFSNGGLATQFIRVLMTESSNTYDTHGTSDARNKMGYAVYELGVGSVDSHGIFTDFISHSPDQNQTPVYVSSNDPWHTAAAENMDTEQVGLDFIFQSSLSQKLPLMVPVPMLYSTPNNAAAEIEYLIRRHYSLVGVELGEEPDGQNMTPEDYAALYIQWAAAIHSVDSGLKVGGPVTSYNGAVTWADSTGDSDYLKRFVAYLSAHGGLSSLGFVSTEHYPFYQANVDWSLVPQEVDQVQSMFEWLTNAKVPKTVPFYVTEYNLSAAPAQPIVDLMGALWHAVFVGEFMKRGGAGAYYYQYLPYQVSSGGTNFGLIGMFSADSNDNLYQPTSQFFSSQLMCLEWCLPGKGNHSLLPATSSIVDSNGNEVVLPYVVSRPDGQYGVMLVNTDAAVHTVTVTFSNTSKHYFTGTVSQSQFSSKDYVWVANGLDSAAAPDGPYEKSTIAATGTTSYSLPAHSITVLRGKIK